jgi:Fe2+ or Zn2+ uptake regulation protein
MQRRQQALTEVVEAILRYLAAHPDAVDSAEGIAQWWLPAECHVDLDTMEAALERLLRQGLIRQRTNADQHVLYSR